MFIKIFLIAIVLVAISVAGIAIKMFVKKDGQFVKTCGSVDPKSGKIVACSCGDEEGKTCENKISEELARS